MDVTAKSGEFNNPSVCRLEIRETGGSYFQIFESNVVAVVKPIIVPPWVCFVKEPPVVFFK